jgi:hypothetical protein
MDRLWLALAFKLPQRLVYWCAIRLLSRATVGEYYETEVSSITAICAIKRWEKTRGKPFSNKKSGNQQEGKRNASVVPTGVYVRIGKILSVRDRAVDIWREAVRQTV